MVKTPQAEGSILDPRDPFRKRHEPIRVLRRPLLRLHPLQRQPHALHRHDERPGFTARYNVTRLVYFEEAGHPQVAIAREKELKGWIRARKLALVSEANPTWRIWLKTRDSFRPNGDVAAVLLQTFARMR